MEKEEFDRRQREHEVHLLEIEQKEVERREEEVRKRNDELADKRRKNKLVQDKMQEQVSVTTITTISHNLYGNLTLEKRVTASLSL